MHRPLIWFAAFALTVPAALAAASGFERFIDPGCSDESECAYWRPKLAPLAGWYLDEEASTLFLGNVLVPVGAKYDDAKTVMYVKAVENTRINGEANTVAEFMAIDREDTVRNFPGTTFADAPALKNGNGSVLKSRDSSPAAGGENRFERVAYDKQGKFFVTFTLSSDSKAGLEAGVKDFERLIAAYKVKP